MTAQHPKPRKNSETIQEIDVQLIQEPLILLHPDETPASLHELADSIKAQGLINPIVVRKTGNTYQLIAGYRRWKAARTFGIPKLKARVLDYDDTQAFLATISENVHRLESDPLQEAQVFQKLTTEHDLTEVQIAEKFGKTRQYVQNRLNLLKLPQKLHPLIKEGRLSLGAASQLYRLEDPQTQMLAAGDMLDRNMNIKEAEAFITSVLEWARIQQETPSPEVIHQAAIEVRFTCDYCDKRHPYAQLSRVPMCKNCEKILTYLFQKDKFDHPERYTQTQPETQPTPTTTETRRPPGMKIT